MSSPQPASDTPQPGTQQPERASSPAPPPLVLVHGLWDTPGLFRRLEKQLEGSRDPVLVPHLPHGLGERPVIELAKELGQAVEARFGPEQEVDVLGFSLGGVIARSWIQLQGGRRRTRRFISVGSPQQGSLLALPWPRRWLSTVADLRPGSPLLQRLNDDPAGLEGVACTSFWCLSDQMVVPSWTGVLPVGPKHQLPVWHHQQLITSPAGLEPIVKELLRP
ncbi:MAG: lipase family alpha/beta hydrolase [Prochlorococcaceae cyanobacterium]